MTAEEYQQENHVHTCSAIIVTRLITEGEVIIFTEAGSELTPDDASDAGVSDISRESEAQARAASLNGPLHLT